MSADTFKIIDTALRKHDAIGDLYPEDLDGQIARDDAWRLAEALLTARTKIVILQAAVNDRGRKT